MFTYIGGSQVPKASPEVKISAQKKGLPPQKGGNPQTNDLFLKDRPSSKISAQKKRSPTNKELNKSLE